MLQKIENCPIDPSFALKVILWSSGALCVLSFGIATTVAYFNPCSWQKDCTVDGHEQEESTDYHVSEAFAIMSIIFSIPPLGYLLWHACSQNQQQSNTRSINDDPENPEEDDEAAMENRPLLGSV